MTDDAFELMMDIIETDWKYREELAYNWWDGVKFMHEVLADKSEYEPVCTD